MIEEPSRTLTELQPRSKSEVSASNTSLAATSSKPSPSSRPHLQARPAASDRIATIDSTSDKATAAFIRRTLCAHQLHTAAEKARADPPRIEEVLPPLTSSNEVDLQLYAFIAILIKEYVHPWYARITSDHFFVDEVVQIIAHCTRALEERFRRLDLETLLLDDWPFLVDAHVNAYRIARRAARSHTAPSDERFVYHTLRPHPALSPVPDQRDPTSVLQQNQNDNAYRHLLAQGLLAVLLPTDDLRNPCLRSLVSEVFADLILGNFVSGRLCDGTFLYDGIRKAAETLQPRIGAESWAVDKSRQGKDRLTQYGLVPNRRASRPAVHNVSRIFWIFAQYAYVTFNGLRLVINALAGSSTLPGRGSRNTTLKGGQTAPDEGEAPNSTFRHSGIPVAAGRQKPPTVEYRIWPALANIVNLRQRMPWLSGFISLLHHLLLYGPGQVGGTDSRLDRLIAHHLRTLFAPPSKHLPPLLLTLRASLFPNNTLPLPQPPQFAQTDPSTAKQTACRAAAFAILNLLPQSVARVYLLRPRGGGQGQEQEKETDGRLQGRGDGEVEEMVVGVCESLELFGGDAYLTRHLVYSMLELVVARVVPELAETGMGKGVGELLAERGVGVGM